MTERLATVDRRRATPPRPRVVIAGAGVAGLEALLALRALAGDRVAITLVAPELRFVNRSMAVAQPFSPQSVRGVRLQDVTVEHGARWHRGALDRVERKRRIVVTKAGHELAYDKLVLARRDRAAARKERIMSSPLGATRLLGFGEAHDPWDVVALGLHHHESVRRQSPCAPAASS